MKKLLLPLVLFATFTKAQTRQDYYNASPSGIDPVSGMTSNGESESVKASNEAIKKNQEAYKGVGEKLQKSQQKVENLEVPKFEDINQNKQEPEVRSYDEPQNTPSSDVDPFGSSDNESPSFQGERVDVDQYYDQKPDGSYVKKDTTSRKSNDTLPLIIVGITVLLAIVGFVYQSNNGTKKAYNASEQKGVNQLRNSLIQKFEDNYRTSYKSSEFDKVSLSLLASSSLNELYTTLKEKSFFLSNQYDVDQSEVSMIIDECYKKVYYKYF